jgi:exopolysaccharide biosynthesis polyprenyl glycosylphosphotransferase
MAEHAQPAAVASRIKRRLVLPAWGPVALDLTLAVAAFVLAYIVRYRLQILRPVFEANNAPFEPYIPYVVLYAALLLLNYRGIGLYKPVRGRGLLEEIYKIVNGVTNATVVVMAVSFVFQPTVFSRLMLVYSAAFSILLLALVRIIERAIRAYLRARGIGVQRVLVVGAGDTARRVLQIMLGNRSLGFQPVGYLDDDPTRGSSDMGRLRGLGAIDNLERAVQQFHVDRVVITLPWRYHDRIIDLIQTCQRFNVDVSVVPDVFQLNLRQLQIENLDGIPLLSVHGAVPLQGGTRVLKRLFDLLFVLLAAPVWLPIFGLVALAIRLEGPGPIFYFARRTGESGREFRMMKFRSMVPNAEAMRDDLIRTLELDPRHPKIKDDPRVTQVGRFIRRTSLDELPNLINVLLGHMSLVGPRPPTPDEVRLYQPWHMQRLTVKPGMTGLWQVSGRSDVPFDEMCLLDIYYIENWSMQLDAQILMMTVPRVLLRQGAY